QRDEAAPSRRAASGDGLPPRRSNPHRGGRRSPLLDQFLRSFGRRDEASEMRGDAMNKENGTNRWLPRRCFWAGIVLAARALVAPIASAAPSSSAPAEARAQAKRMYQRAMRHYSAGEYEAAAADLLKAYEQVPLPPLLFNLGLTYLKLGRKDEA